MTESPRGTLYIQIPIEAYVDDGELVYITYVLGLLRRDEDAEIHQNDIQSPVSLRK